MGDDYSREFAQILRLLEENAIFLVVFEGFDEKIYAPPLLRSIQ